MRLRILFAKTDSMRYTSHLDLYRTWERTLRRAGLPLAYSQGFNPHPHINLASALPLGFTGENELIDVWLEKEVPSGEIQHTLEQAAPPGIKIKEIFEIDDRAPALQMELEASEYVITFLEQAPELNNRLGKLLAIESLLRRRRGKDYDLRPLILELKQIDDDEQGHPRLFARLSARESATGRPEEVIAALGYSPEMTRVHRMGLVFKRQ